MSETVPEFGGCVWPMDPACLTEEWTALDEDVQARSLQLATATLERLTARRVGNCPITVRPCAPCAAVGFPAYYNGMVPLNWNGVWTNTCDHQVCDCTVACEIRLPRPVGRVDEVKVDGAVVDEDDYEVRGDSVVWVGVGDCPFPAKQDLSLADTEEGTFSVTYLNAYPVDSLGAYAAGVLATEFSRACNGGACSLPRGVQTVTRNGVSFDIVTGMFPDGMTGIEIVDVFIGLWNPKGMTHGASVYSPDLPRYR